MRRHLRVRVDSGRTDGTPLPAVTWTTPWLHAQPVCSDSHSRASCTQRAERSGLELNDTERRLELSWRRKEQHFEETVQRKL